MPTPSPELPLPAVQVDGAGPHTIVMIHGWPDTLRVWDSTTAGLKHRYRCVRFTLPGFDDPDNRRAFELQQVTRLIARVVDAASPGKPVILLLHDWGCFFGYQYAEQHSARVQRVIGLDIGDAGSRQHVASLSAGAKLGAVAYQWWLALAWKLGGTIGNRMARWVARLFRAPARQHEVTSGMGYPYAMHWFGTAGGLGKTKAFVSNQPMLFIYGERKPFNFHSQAWADRLAAQPGSRVLALPTGHWVMTQKPEAFNNAVLQWLAQTDGALP
jgi:pimeloyl-ACP methyl ester carboxylesterase